MQRASVAAELKETVMTETSGNAFCQAATRRTYQLPITSKSIKSGLAQLAHLQHRPVLVHRHQTAVSPAGTAIEKTQPQQIHVGETQ